MGNNAPTGSVMKIEGNHNPYTNLQLSHNWAGQASIAPPTDTLYPINLLSDQLDRDACKENQIPDYTNSTSEEYVHQINTSTIFYPRLRHEHTSALSGSVEVNSKRQLRSGDIPHRVKHQLIRGHNDNTLSKSNLPYSTTEKDNTIGRNGITVANIIEATSRYMYEKTTGPRMMSQEDDDDELDTQNGLVADEPSRPDLSTQLSFDIDPGFPGPTTNKPSRETEETKATTDLNNLDKIPLKNTRNFSIIAHIDHGKSTLADRLLEMTGALKAKAENKQVLDKLQVEKDRGITVKAQTASLFYKYKDEEYLLNLIDTPGHVDFSNEVARSLAACQGVILLVDANQGVQAQTVANFYLAFGKDLTVVPVLNKIDLKNANPDMCKDQLFNLFSIDPEDVLMISAKSGLGVEELMQAIVQRVPPPPGDRAAPMRALIFDSWYDKYRGAVALVYVRDGVVRLGDDITSAHTKQKYNVKGLGLLRPHEVATDKLVGGQVGWMACNMRTVAEAHIGDTLHHWGKTSIEPLVGFTPARPMVFAGVYPMDQAEYNDMRNAIEKLALNDPAVSLTPESSPVLGQGWRVGFLGLLHLEVFNQRLEQEYGAEAIMTAPSVPYKVKLKNKKLISQYGGEEITMSDPSKLPEQEDIEEILEPTVLGTIITPLEYAHKIIPECIERRGVQKASTTIDNNRTMLQFILPLNEIIVDFHDALKAQTSGFASFDYEDHGYQAADLVKLDIRVNGKVVESLSSIVYRGKAESLGRRLCEKLVKIIPRQMVEVAIQAAVGGRILARETIKAFRKDVTAKLYGGDRTRKMKLLKKQSEGKKRMKLIANVNIPREAFIDYMKR